MYILWMTGQCWTERKCKTLHFNWTQRAKEVFWVCPYKIRVEKLFPPHWEARSWYCRWFQELVANGIRGLEILFISAEIWFISKGNVSCQNDRYGCCENPHAVHDFPCLTFNFALVYSECKQNHSTHFFFKKWWIYVVVFCWFWHHSPKMSSFKSVPLLFWGTLKDKSLCEQSVLLQELKDSTGRYITSIFRQELHYVTRNIFRMCVACLETWSQHFMILLLNQVNWTMGKYIP